MNSKFKAWLTSTCFQEPPKHAIDLAQGAWEKQQRKINILEDAIRLELGARAGDLVDASIRRMQEVLKEADDA